MEERRSEKDGGKTMKIHTASAGNTLHVQVGNTLHVQVLPVKDVTVLFHIQYDTFSDESQMRLRHIKKAAAIISFR